MEMVVRGVGRKMRRESGANGISHFVIVACLHC